MSATTGSDCGVLIHKSVPFVSVPKPALDEPKVSWRAKGILAYLLGKPDGWKVRVTDICKHATEGRDAVRNALSELRRFGYIKLTQGRQVGKFGPWNWEVFSTPCAVDNSAPDEGDSPNPEKPDTEKPHPANPYVSKNDCTKNDCTKNGQSQVNSTGTVPIVPFPDADASGALSLNLLESSGELKASESEKENVAKKEKSPRIVLSDAWMAAYLAVFGRTYPFDDSADGKGLTLLLALKMPVAEIIGIAKDAWQHARTKGDRFNFSRSSPSLLRFAQSFNLIAAEVRPAQTDYSEGFR